MLAYGIVGMVLPLLPAPSVPLACAVEREHTCSCRADVHQVKDCCCADGHGEEGCRFTQLPCDGGTAPEVLATFGWQPLALPTTASPAPAPPFTGVAYSTGDQRALAGFPGALTPPPRLTGLG